MTALESAGPRDVIARRSLHGELVERLRDLITSGALAPGSKIQEPILCERFGVSRTPLREALKVLASEGIVTLLTNRGAVVTTLTVAELEEVFPVMGALESLSGEIACRHITDAEIASIAAIHKAMVEHWRRGEMQSYFRLNQSIHEAILNATRNDTLKSVYRGLAGRLLTARYVANMSAERWAQAVDEHEAILESLKTRNGRRLARILREHLANKLETVKSWLAESNPATAANNGTGSTAKRRGRRAGRKAI